MTTPKINNLCDLDAFRDFSPKDIFAIIRASRMEGSANKIEPVLSTRSSSTIFTLEPTIPTPAPTIISATSTLEAKK